MDETFDPKTAADVAEALLAWRALDEESIEIIEDDKIATGG